MQFLPDRVIYLTREEAEKDADQQQTFYAGIPSGGDNQALAAQIHENDATVLVEIVEDNSGIIMFTIFLL